MNNNKKVCKTCNKSKFKSCFDKKSKRKGELNIWQDICRNCKKTANKDKMKYEKIASKSHFYKSKHKCEDQIINYSNSPTGKAYIGINKKPLMPNKDGFGFQGVLLQDENRCLIQCNSCGEWFKRLTSKHTQNCSGLTIRDYKRKYGLNLTQGLVSDDMSLIYTKCCLKNKQKIKPMSKNFLDKIRKKSRVNRTRQMENKHGTCPEQLKQRTIEFVKCNREFPSSSNRGRALYKAIVRRFGSLGKGLKFFGFPHFKRIGTNYIYTFPDYTVFKFNINKFDQREELYNLIKQKCLIMQ
jgi:hypothetical protein